MSAAQLHPAIAASMRWFAPQPDAEARARVYIRVAAVEEVQP